LVLKERLRPLETIQEGFGKGMAKERRLKEYGKKELSIMGLQIFSTMVTRKRKL